MGYFVFMMAVTIMGRTAQTTAFSSPALSPEVVHHAHATTSHLLKRIECPPHAPQALYATSRFDELEHDMEPLLEALKDEYDTREQLVELPVMFTGEKEGQSFDMERWNTHRSSSRYVRLLSGVFFSVTTRRILPTVLILVAWSIGIDLYNSVEHIYGLPELEIPLTPFELTAPILGLLLVFRTDRAFDRFNEGSDYSWEITNLFKSVIREILSFSAAERFLPEERDAAYDIMEACVLLHGWIMIDYLRGKQIDSMMQTRILQLALGPSSMSATNTEGNVLAGSTEPSAYHMAVDTPLTPTSGIAAISLGITRRISSLDFQESTLIESQFAQIVCSLSKCEMMLRTPIPLGYTRYSVRFLWIWLSLLPFALVNTFSGFGMNTWWEDKPQPVLVFAMLFIGYIFISIEDIAVQIEEPFGVLPLELHQKWLIRDAKQLETMNQLSDEMKDDLARVNRRFDLSRRKINGQRL